MQVWTIKKSFELCQLMRLLSTTITNLSNCSPLQCVLTSRDWLRDNLMLVEVIQKGWSTLIYIFKTCQFQH